MKLIIAGGRKYQFTVYDIQRLNSLHTLHTVTEVVSGGATGADECGEIWAGVMRIPVKRFNAAWGDLSHPDALIRARNDGVQYDVRAGFRRNEQMAQYADAAVLLPGGSGTADMWARAKVHRLEIFDWRTP